LTSRDVTAISNRTRLTKAISRIDDDAAQELKHRTVWRPGLIPAGPKTSRKRWTRARQAGAGSSNQRSSIQSLRRRGRARQASLARRPLQELRASWIKLTPKAPFFVGQVSRSTAGRRFPCEEEAIRRRRGTISTR
jgi:hypothetical protein